MGRWLALAAGVAWLAAVAIWLHTGSPSSDGAAVQAQLWGLGMPRVSAPLNARGVCALEHVDRTHASTALCLSCHDGSVGNGVEFRGNVADPGISHPVGVDYGLAYVQKPGEFVPPGALPYDVPLVDGKVACTSCHDPASRESSHVSRPQSLCTACHNK